MAVPYGQLIRYGLIGVVNTTVAYAVFAILLAVGLHYALATLAGGVAGMILGFRLSGRFVFLNRDKSRFFHFAIVFVIIYIINVSIQKLLQPWVNPYVGGAIATALGFFLSFGLNRNFVFKAGTKEDPKSYDQNYAQVQIRRSRNPVRKFVRRIYLNDILQFVNGPSIDFGCGAGDLLALLPKGSIGLEINPAAVVHGRIRGLDVRLYDPASDEYDLKGYEAGGFRTLILTHVMEHFDDPEQIIRTLLKACRRLGISRIIITVPGARGFRFDPTHRTFIDENYLELRDLKACEDYRVSFMKYFPINQKWIGDYYVFHELRIIWDRENKSQSAGSLTGEGQRQDSAEGGGSKASLRTPA